MIPRRDTDPASAVSYDRTCAQAGVTKGAAQTAATKRGATEGDRAQKGYAGHLVREGSKLGGGAASRACRMSPLRR
eukprot:389321-Prorocentrum_minimum.AAC.3